MRGAKERVAAVGAASPRAPGSPGWGGKASAQRRSEDQPGLAPQDRLCASGQNMTVKGVLKTERGCHHLSQCLHGQPSSGIGVSRPEAEATRIQVLVLDPSCCPLQHSFAAVAVPDDNLGSTLPPFVPLVLSRRSCNCSGPCSLAWVQPLPYWIFLGLDILLCCPIWQPLATCGSLHLL